MKPQTNGIDFTEKTVLIIEDETDIMRLLEFRLKKLGFQVATAKNGDLGLKKARALRPHLVVMDLMLPELPGEEICKAIREDDDEEFCTTPIIMVTAKNTDVDRVLGKSIGANSYITKPFDIEFLVKEIQRVFGF